jgi:hypothetical protein
MCSRRGWREEAAQSASATRKCHGLSRKGHKASLLFAACPILPIDGSIVAANNLHLFIDFACLGNKLTDFISKKTVFISFFINTMSFSFSNLICQDNYYHKTPHEISNVNDLTTFICSYILLEFLQHHPSSFPIGSKIDICLCTLVPKNLVPMEDSFRCFQERQAI